MGPILSSGAHEPSAVGKPWVVLIHGLGMSHRSWTDPFSETLLNGNLSFDYVLTDYHSSFPVANFPYINRVGCSPPLRLAKNPPPSFGNLLKKEGFGIVTWSQGKPMGKIIHALGELQTILGSIPRGEKKILVGHSRGGLVARKYLQEHRIGWDEISGVILLGVPNHGSRIAEWADHFPQNLFSRFMEAGKGEAVKILRKKDQGSLLGMIRSLIGYLGNEGIEELSPRSDFIKDLAFGEKEEEGHKTRYFNLVGTRTEFIRFYRLGPLSAAKPKALFSLLDGLERILPGHLTPPELKKEMGDGQVSVKSSILPWAESNQLLPVNHAQFLVDEGVQERVKEILNIL